MSFSFLTESELLSYIVGRCGDYIHISPSYERFTEFIPVDSEEDAIHYIAFVNNITPPYNCVYSDSQGVVYRK
jgi:hypothetical protein